ncbi:MAG: TMEM175 family protein [Terriglobales bacterium]
MNKGRLEAFSDGVLAIIITVMVLELRTPSGATLAALRPFVAPLLIYMLSFTHIAIYWNNHHHLLHAARRVNGAVLWANLHLLFWLSLVPVTTAWIGNTGLAALPVALYGAVLLCSGAAYYVLSRALIAAQGEGSLLATAIGRDTKGRISVFAYAVAIALAFAEPWLAAAIYVGVAVLWMVPDRRIERQVSD